MERTDRSISRRSSRDRERSRRHRRSRSRSRGYKDSRERRGFDASSSKRSSRRSRSRSSRRSRRSRTRSRSRQRDSPRYNVENIVKSTVENLTKAIQQRKKESLNEESAHMIPEFRGDINQSVDLWLQKIESLKAMHNWSDTETVVYTTGKLADEARKWYESLKKIDLTWPEWKEKIHSTFSDGYKKALKDKLRAISGRKKKDDENFSEYYHAKLALLVSTFCDEKKAMRFIIHGIGDDAVRASIKDADFSSLEEMRMFFSDCDML